MQRLYDARLHDQFNPEEERSNFVTWVNHVMDKHLGPNVGEFKVAFDLNDTSQSHVDKWVAFAAEKRVKILDLNFTSVISGGFTNELHLKNHMSSRFATLTSLRLKKVRVSDQFIDCLVRTCTSLEDLCIVNSRSLIDVSLVSFSLQCLEVSRCHELKSVTISAPKLRSFTHYSYSPIELNVRHASSLSNVCTGGHKSDYSISYVFESLVNYFSQLEHLTLLMSLSLEPTLGIIDLPRFLGTLRHLQLCGYGTIRQSLLGWTSFIGALPSLEMLTFKLSCGEATTRTWPIMKQDGPPLKRLKTLEICGFIGQAIDLEIATYVFENAIALEHVIVDYGKQFNTWPLGKPRYHDETAPTRLVDL